MRRSEPWTPNILPLRVPNRAAILKQKFQDSLALPFEQALPEAVIQKVLRFHGVSYRQTLYTPIVVVWAWMSQVLDSDKSLSNAVSRVLSQKRFVDRKSCSIPVAYCAMPKSRDTNSIDARTSPLLTP